MSKWSAVFGHTIVIERPRGWRGFGWVIGPLGGVLGCNTHEAFSVPRLTVGASNEVQMVRNFIGGLPVVNQGHLASIGPIRECLAPAHEKRQKRTPEDIGAPDCKTDNGENARMHETNTYANAIHMMT